jgi:hypothetical protein
MALALYLCLESHFVFLFVHFQVGALDHHLLAISITEVPSSSSLVVTYEPTYLIHLLEQRVGSPKFHQLSKTKLGLSLTHLASFCFYSFVC